MFEYAVGVRRTYIPFIKRDIFPPKRELAREVGNENFFSVLQVKRKRGFMCV